MIGIIILTLTALICSIILVTIDKYANKETKETKIIELLPGYNCNGCGFGSCSGMAKALLEDANAIDRCRPIKKEEAEKLKEYIKMK